MISIGFDIHVVFHLEGAWGKPLNNPKIVVILKTLKKCKNCNPILVFSYHEWGNSLSINSKCPIAWLGLSQRALFVFIYEFLSAFVIAASSIGFISRAFATKFLLQHLIVKYSRISEDCPQKWDPWDFGLPRTSGIFVYKSMSEIL